MAKGPEREQFERTLLEGSKSAFWKEIVKYIETAANPERFLDVKNEMGMKGFWYLKGYIKGQRDIKNVVEAAVRAAEKSQS